MEELRLGADTDFVQALATHPGFEDNKKPVKIELELLPSILVPGEVVLDIIQAYLGVRTGVLFRTRTRVVHFVASKTWRHVEEFPLDRILSVEYATGRVFRHIRIFTAGNSSLFAGTTTAHTKPFVDGLRAQLEALKQASAATRTEAASHGLVSELERLVGLRDRGVLTDEEFAAAKRKLLGL